jgi:6-phosphofructokinase
MAGKANAFYAQSGGVTSVINASACGVIETARRAPRPDRQGSSRGATASSAPSKRTLIDTSRESAKSAIRGLMQTPAGAFGSCRHKLKSLEDNREEYERLIEVFRAHDIRYFFLQRRRRFRRHMPEGLPARRGPRLSAAGHTRSQDHRQRPADHGQLSGLRIRREVRGRISTREAAHGRGESMCATSTKVFILEVMGRHAGWIAAAAGLAAAADVATHRTASCSRKSPSTRRSFLARVDRSVKKLRLLCGRRLGRHADRRRPFSESDAGTRDAFGHAQLGGLAPALAGMVKDRLGYKYHWAVADYLQRSARHVASQTDVDQAYAVGRGRGRVRRALAGTRSCPAIVRGKRQALQLAHRFEAPLDKVANVEKKMPRNFITRDGFGITPVRARVPCATDRAARPTHSYRDGLPDLRPAEKRTGAGARLRQSLSKCRLSRAATGRRTSQGTGSYEGRTDFPAFTAGYNAAPPTRRRVR